MKVILPMMVQDQALAGYSKLVEGFAVTTEPYFLDGPVTERVAILDFDEKTGELLSATPFFLLSPTKASGSRGEYRIAEKIKLFDRVDGKKVYRIDTRDFNRVSLLATILKTMALFEDDLVLGRKLHWAFDNPQLLVIPRAGLWANAFYQRETQSLQFFYFPKASVQDDGETMVYTSLSRDIIAHETAHAILDGIVPDIYDASTPQSLAIHEALADLTAVILAFQSRNLATAVLESTGGKINFPNQFSRIAEEFGQEHSGLDALRELATQPDMNKVNQEPHSLSIVLSSALYELMMFLYAAQWDIETKALEQKNESLPEDKQYKDTRLSSSGKALALASMAFARIVFGALDFLPPGEVSFADVGRAIVAAQQNLIAHDAVPKQKRKNAKRRVAVLRDAFQKRNIPLVDGSPLLQTDFPENPLENVDLRSLEESDWAAYQFAHQYRELLRIPADIPFKVSPRYTADKQLGSKRSPLYQYQLIFKVSWDQVEPIGFEHSLLPNQRRVVVGTTFVIDLDAQKPIAILHTDQDSALQSGRDELLKLLLERDILHFGDAAFGPTNEVRDGGIQADETDGALKLYGVSRMLHIATT